MQKSINIYHCPDIVAGNPSFLSRGLKSLGCNSRLYYFSKSKYDFASKDDINLSSKFLKPYLVIYLFFKILIFADVVHYNNGRTLFLEKKIINKSDSFVKKLLKFIFNFTLGKLFFLDARIFHIFGKKLAITFQGSDGRLSKYHKDNYEFSHYNVLEENIEVDEFKRIKISLVDKYIDHIYVVNPDLLNNFPPRSRFTPYTSLDLKDCIYRESSSSIKKIIHCPSNLDVKGTKYVLKAIDRLRSEGYKFEFELVTNIPREEMPKKLETASLLIDQLLVGWYGGVAVEAMSLSVPVMANIQEEDLKFVSESFKKDFAIINVKPDTLYEKLKTYLEMDLIEENGLRKKSLSFVQKHHDIYKIASSILQDYKS